MSVEIKSKIEKAIQQFENSNLFDSGIHFFNSLGYRTERELRLSKNNFKGFIDEFPIASEKLNSKKALSKQWKTIELLFQLTQTEMTRQSFLFDTGKVDNTIIEAYLFFAIELTESDYTRTELSDITREINKVFLMPVMVLFKYNNQLTLSVIKRRLHKRDESKDVLEKVTLIKDIHIKNPHRAHVEILYDLSFDKLQSDFEFRNFVELHNAWQKTLDSSELNKRFYKELANWYFWAVDTVEFPDDVEKEREKRNSTNVIRMLTRLIFVWFLKEKDNLIPDELFNKKKLDKILDYKDKTGSTYYKAILQNLFFATLNTEMNKDVPDNRTFIKRQYGIQEFYRYERFFKDKETALKLFENIPFLNGGLFENLDKNVGEPNEQRIDCFSNNRKNEERLSVPDFLFFETEKQYDKLNKVYDTSNKKYVVRGLLEILNKYKFTIHENTPIEEEIALDPELLGKVFENLLASYNEETKTTARKLTGSFYTPREVVNYMVEESLIAYLKNCLNHGSDGSKDPTDLNISVAITDPDNETRLRDLFSYNENEPPFTEKEINILIGAIDNCKIVDPACGSGAFPMGILHKMVFILGKLDPHNERWMQRQIDKVYDIPDTTLHDNLKAEIERAFKENYNDYGRKLYLIENCIYGVDIQPIAVQIAKLRFFISLIVDQKVNREAKNLGIRPLPNLETKFVAANTLIGIERPKQMTLRNAAIDEKEKQLRDVRERHFNARTPATKKKYRERDKELRKELADLLEKDGFKPEATRLMASWDPYDQNKFAGFFDSEWMFGLQKGFDVVIGNPPWGAKLTDEEKKYLTKQFPIVPTKIKDSYLYFLTKSLEILSPNAFLSLIIPNTWLLINNADEFRKHILNYKIVEIDDYGDGIFEQVTVESSTLFVANTKDKTHAVKVKRFKKLELVSDNLIDKKMWNSDSLCRILLDITTANKKIIDLTEKNSEQFSVNNQIIWGIKPYQIGYGNPQQTESDVKNRIYHSRHKKGKDWQPLLVGSSVNRYKIKYDDLEFIKYGIWLMYPSNIELMKSEKILLRQTSDILRAAFDDSKYLAQNSLFLIHSNKYNLKYLTALLNSTLLNFIYKIKNPQKGKVFAEVKPSVVKELPIFKADKKNQLLFSAIVDFIIELKKTTKIQAFLKP